MKEIQKKYGSFGRLSEMYDKARRGMPPAVLDYFFSMFNENPRVLDIGCGTGIITRQLHDKGVYVLGVDKDSQMLRVAESHKTDGIEYIKAPVNKLPFEEASFDAATAFSSFHWFDDVESSKEMLRVLKPGGILFIANRKATPAFLSGYKNVVKPFIDGEFPEPKDRAFTKPLVSAGFVEVIEKKFLLKEMYTIEELVEYIQSTSPWNLVREGEEELTRDALRKYFYGREQDGMVKKLSFVLVVSARKARL